jgi:phosphate transport system permease protein
MFCGGLVLGIMILPIVTAISRDVLRAVPREQIEGTQALGATWWQSSWGMLRYSRAGLLGAVLLGLARAAGETMAVTMVIGNNPRISSSLYAPQHTMAAVIANEFSEADTSLYLSALVEIGLVLFIITLVVNAMSRGLIWSMNRKPKPAKAPVAATAEAAAV